MKAQEYRDKYPLRVFNVEFSVPKKYGENTYMENRSVAVITIDLLRAAQLVMDDNPEAILHSVHSKGRVTERSVYIDQEALDRG